MTVQFAIGWKQFFASDGYPFDLNLVEQRDDTDGQVAFLRLRLPAAPATVLDLGSGNGRHSNRLAEAGYEMIAVDRLPCPSAHYTAIAADLGQLPFGNRSVDACISMYTSAGYGRQISLQLKEWHRVTRPHGSLILDFANRKTRLRYGIDRFPGGNGAMLSARLGSRRYQGNIALQGRRARIFGFSYPEPSLDQLVRMVKQTGWDVVGAYGDFASRNFSRTAPRLIIHACRA